MSAKRKLSSVSSLTAFAVEVLKFLLLIPEFTVENRGTMDETKEADEHLGGLFQMLF